MIAASAVIVWRVIEFPAVRSIIATEPLDSQTVMYLSDSSEHEPNLTLSPGTERGGFTN